MHALTQAQPGVQVRRGRQLRRTVQQACACSGLASSVAPLAQRRQQLQHGRVPVQKGIAASMMRVGGLTEGKDRTIVATMEA
eukprot:357881-Chlamydomonas_euryale.AAC.6